MKILLLSDVMPYINPHYVVNIHTGEMSPIDAYENPQLYKVFQIDYDEDERCIRIMIEPV